MGSNAFLEFFAYHGDLVIVTFLDHGNTQLVKVKVLLLRFREGRAESRCAARLTGQCSLFRVCSSLGSLPLGDAGTMKPGRHLLREREHENEDRERDPKQKVIR